ncbi:hypothetical protein ACWDUL_21230 [Nocardia niigatensis]
MASTTIPRAHLVVSGEDHAIETLAVAATPVQARLIVDLENLTHPGTCAARLAGTVPAHGLAPVPEWFTLDSTALITTLRGQLRALHTERRVLPDWDQLWPRILEATLTHLATTTPVVHVAFDRLDAGAPITLRHNHLGHDHGDRYEPAAVDVHAFHDGHRLVSAFLDLSVTPPARPGRGRDEDPYLCLLADAVWLLAHVVDLLNRVAAV